MSMNHIIQFALGCAGALAARSALAEPLPDDPGVPLSPPRAPFPANPGAPGPFREPIPAGPLAEPSPASIRWYRTDPLLAESDRPGPYSYAWRDPYLASGIGIGFSVGGGLTAFTDRQMRETTTSAVGGLWDARATIGTHIPIGVDIGYLGTAANINTIAGAPNGTLIGTTIEAALRYNILPHYRLDPYVFAGAGWQRYDVRDMQFARSDTGMASHDNVAVYPVGAGLAFRDRSGLTFDARGTFRAASDSTLLIDSATGAYAHLHSWEASAALGYEF
jgi:hypothetical protein